MIYLYKHYAMNYTRRKTQIVNVWLPRTKYVVSAGMLYGMN